MISVYRIYYDEVAPKMGALDEVRADLLLFDGGKKSEQWPRGGLPVVLGSVADKFAFYRLGDGALVYREDAILACDDFYWVITQESETLHAMGDEVVFNIANVTAILKPPSIGEPGFNNGAPCTISSFYVPIFRIAGRPITDLYCISGLTNPMNEFKAVYDHYGFTGLCFEEIWAGL